MSSSRNRCATACSVRFFLALATASYDRSYSVQRLKMTTSSMYSRGSFRINPSRVFTPRITSHEYTIARLRLLRADSRRPAP